MKKVLEALANAKREPSGDAWVEGRQLENETGLSPADINDAVERLCEEGSAESLSTMGTAPFKFARVQITAKGRHTLQP
jgi:hypothetical protein